MRSARKFSAVLEHLSFSAMFTCWSGSEECGFNLEKCQNSEAILRDCLFCN